MWWFWNHFRNCFIPHNRWNIDADFELFVGRVLGGGLREVSGVWTPIEHPNDEDKLPKKLVKHKGSVPNWIWQKQNEKTQSYKNIVNYMTNEEPTVEPTDWTPKRWRQMAQKACKTQGIRAEQNLSKTKRKNEKLQKHCKLHDKRRTHGRSYGGGTTRRRRIACKNAMETCKHKRPTQHPRTRHVTKRL